MKTIYATVWFDRPKDCEQGRCHCFHGILSDCLGCICHVVMSEICDAVSLFVMQCIHKEKKQIQVSDLFSKECITFSFTLRALRAIFCVKLSIYGE